MIDFEQYTEDMITAAADWWTKAIEMPLFNNGDDSAQGGMAAALAMMDNKPKADADLEKFRAGFIVQMKADFADGRAPRIVGVDYGPDMWLKGVAERAGIATSISDWPWKTVMWLTDGKVTVSAGCGAPIEQIFPSVNAPILLP